MRELIDILQGLTEALDSDAEGGVDLAKKYGFGTVEWQNEMLYRIKDKLKNNEDLDGADRAFIETQIQHNRQLADELRTLGYDEGRLNVN